MTSFLVEAYTPASAPIAEIEARARLAAAEVSQAGTAVRYVHAIFVPEDELCLHQFEGASSAVCEAVRRAGISPQRIVEAVTSGERSEDHEQTTIL